MNNTNYQRKIEFEDLDMENYYNEKSPYRLCSRFQHAKHIAESLHIKIIISKVNGDWYVFLYKPGMNHLHVVMQQIISASTMRKLAN